MKTLPAAISRRRSQRLRELLEGAKILVVPNAYDCLSAKAIQAYPADGRVHDHCPYRELDRGQWQGRRAQASQRIRRGRVNAIMIHSKSADVTEVLELIQRYRSARYHSPIAVVPMTYNRITAMDLHAHEVNIVIEANHLLRSAYPVMVKTDRSILEHDCAHDADEKHCLPIPDTLKLVPSA